MIAFYALAAAMLALALLFVLPPLWRAQASSSGAVQSDDLNLEVLRDQLRELDADLQAGTIDAQAHQSARHELAQRVAQDVHKVPAKVQGDLRQHGAALAAVLLVTVVSASAYLAVGTPQALEVSAAAAVVPPNKGKPPFAEAGAGEGAVTAEQIEGMVARLAEKLKTNPDDVNGWRMLARSYETLRRFDQAVKAREQVLKLAPDDADALVDYAVALAMISGQSLSGAPDRAIQRALLIDPANPQALALSGSAAFERGDYANAIKAWQQILALAPPESDMARSINSSLDKARARLTAKQAGQSAGP